MVWVEKHCGDEGGGGSKEKPMLSEEGGEGGCQGKGRRMTWARENAGGDSMKEYDKGEGK